MVQQYIQYKRDKSKFQTTNPKIEKIILKNMFTIIGAVLLIIIILLVINWMFGLDVFLVTFESFGITVSPSSLLLYAILATVAVTVFLLVGNYLVTRNVRYEFYQNKLILYKNFFLLFIKSKEIPYQNIVKVLYNNDGIFNKIFNCGTIVLELSGMGEDKIELEFIDNVEQTVKYIQDLIQRFRAVKQEETKESYKIEGILDQY